MAPNDNRVRSTLRSGSDGAQDGGKKPFVRENPVLAHNDNNTNANQ